MTASQSGWQASGADSGAIPARSKSRIWKKVLVGCLVCLALAGVIAGILVYRKIQDQKSAAAKEKNQVAKYRLMVDGLWTDLQAVALDVSNQQIKAEGWVSNAAVSASAMTAGLGQLADVPELAGAEAAITAHLALVNQHKNTLGMAMTTVAGLTEQVTSNRLALTSLTNAVQAGVRWAAVTNVPERTAELQMSLSADGAKARKAVDALVVLKQKFEKAHQAFLAAAEKAAAEKAAAEKAAAEQAAAEKAAAEKAALIQNELKLIEEGRKANTALIQQHQFKAVVEALGQVIKGLTTAEAKAAGKLTLKAYQTLVELKTLFVEGVKAEVKANPDKGFSFGWQKRADILGANDESVFVREGQGQNAVLWSAVPPLQIILFFQHYVDNGDLTPRERAQYEFAYALYIYDAMSGNEKARAQVVKHLTSAVRANSSLEEMAKTVMPDVETK
jgi:hypothetical protein